MDEPDLTPRVVELVKADPAVHPWVDGPFTEYVGPWDPECPDLPLVGIRPQMFNMNLWFGNDKGVKISVHYPAATVSQWCVPGPDGTFPPNGPDTIKVPFVGHYAVSMSSGVYLSQIPPGWARITGAAQVRP